jgi:mannose-1-phosphate guanylyltransferase
VVLAGGDGDRVSTVTRDASGAVVPKQYWCCGGRPPMVRWALDRARHIAPSPRVLVVVRGQHRRFWQRHLADVPRQNVLVQPGNRGTAAGVSRALVEIQTRGQAASPVVLLPSDHYVEREDVLHRALVSAVHAARNHHPPVVLLGISPVAAEPGYGWILPDTPAAISGVRRFVEKPPPGPLGEMVREGALINSFMLVARTQVLLGVIGRLYPELLAAFRHAARSADSDSDAWSLYERLPFIDLSRDVLERAVRFLSVLRVPPCGWSDLGTPERLRQFLDQPPRGPRPVPARVHAAA